VFNRKNNINNSFCFTALFPGFFRYLNNKPPGKQGVSKTGTCRIKESGHLLFVAADLTAAQSFDNYRKPAIAV